jgi:hypothetical protein
MLHSSLFSVGDHVQPDVLWKCLESRRDGELLHDSLGNLLSSLTSIPDTMSPQALRMIELKCNIVQQLSLNLSGAHWHVPVHRSSVLHSLHSISILLDALPRLRLLVASGRNAEVGTEVRVSLQDVL